MRGTPALSISKSAIAQVEKPSPDRKDLKVLVAATISVFKTKFKRRRVKLIHLFKDQRENTCKHHKQAVAGAKPLASDEF